MTDTDRDISPEEFERSRQYGRRPVPTGAWVVILRADVEDAAAIVNDACGSVAGDYRVETFSADDGIESAAGGVAFDELGIAVIDHPDGGVSANIASTLMERAEIEGRIPEFYAFADSTPKYVNTATDTWGRQAVRADRSALSGSGVRVAVLDTGVDFQHSEIAPKVVASKSFVPGQLVDDGNGHGTHCAGTVAGSGALPNTPEYGVAPDVDLVVGKVLSNNGAGRQRDILAGMVWALQQGAQIISMSLGGSVAVGGAYNPAYERAAAVALAQDSLVVAAAGNHSARRFGHVAPIGSPADCPSVVAVGAVDQALDVADFSNGDINGGSGVIDVVAPGVDVLSSWPLPRRHRSISGTSMACPHAAAVAALWLQSSGNVGRALRNHLCNQALNLGAADTGYGLVQAP